MVKSKTQTSRDLLVKRYSRWLGEGEPRTVRLLEPSSELKDLLAIGILSYEQRISVSSKMSWIAGYYAATGAVLCFTDPASGWRLIKQGVLYSYWEQRIVYRARDSWPLPKKAFENTANLTPEVALSLAIAQPEALWYLDVMERSRDDGSLSWFGDDFFAAYLVRLYRKLKGEEDIPNIPPNAYDWEQPFNDLIGYWDDEEKLAETIQRMCDYHVRWNGRDSGMHRAEFAAPVAMVNPIEIHALEAVRDELGLSTPKVEHELLQPPFYPLPDVAKEITNEEIFAEDDLLRRIVELNQPWCDGRET